MNKIVKKVIPFLVTVCILLSILSVNVFAAGSSVAFSKNKLTIGETLTVTARFSASSGEKMYSLSGYLTYDPAVLEFVSGDNCNLMTKGKVKIVVSVTGKNNITENVKFKALTAGKSTVALEGVEYSDGVAEQTMTGSSAAVTVTNPSATASSDANLKGLTVSAGTLTPKFDPNVTSYSVTITNDVTELWVSPSKSDANATYTVEGSKDMKVGFNKRVIIVTAENGTTKSYTVNITRLDENGNVPSDETETPGNDITEVTVDDETMYVQEDFSTQTLPEHFSVVDYAFDGKTIPALSDGTYIMIFLSLPDGSFSSFYVVNSDGSFSQLVSVEVGGAFFHILPTESLPVGYSAAEGYEISGIPVPAYKNDAAGQSDFFLVYAKGPGGQTGFYRFDTVDQTMQRADGLTLKSEDNGQQNIDKPAGNENILDSFSELNTNGKIVIITILAVILLLILAIIVLIVKIAMAGRNRREEMEEAEDDLLEDDDSVGFEYISTHDPVAESVPETEPISTQPDEAAEPPVSDITEESEITEETQEDTEAEEDTSEEEE